MGGEARLRPVAVVAVGGNSLIKNSDHTSLFDQNEASVESMEHVAAMIAEGWNVVVTHGNGPQVGFLLRRSELAAGELHTVPLDVLGADTQGAIGYMFSCALHNQFKKLGLDEQAVSIVTQTVVECDDPAFRSPSKPIGSFLTEEQARRHEAEDGWSVVEDSGRGWRRVVPSPAPVRIVELDAIRDLINGGYTVVAAGGGGIPVIETVEGAFHGVEAVIDKDLGSALLANQLKADLLLISTVVDGVAINFNTPQETWLREITADQAHEYLEAGHFGEGSMGPKIGAAISYLANGGKKVIVTSPGKIVAALRGEAGTSIVP
jgi:carbamate kinase